MVMKIQLMHNGMQESIELAVGTSAFDLAVTLQKKGSPELIACQCNGAMCDMSDPLQEGDRVEFFSFDDPVGREVFWHSSAHVLAQAVVRLWPEAIPTIGPPIAEGFYYDFANLTISDQDFVTIEKEMNKIIQENVAPQRGEFHSSEEAASQFQHNPYKIELIEQFGAGGATLSYYSQGEFSDLCRGPHLLSLRSIRALKVLKTSGAYWRGDAKKEMLTRIYGITFPDKKLLKEYLHRIEEAKKRDHKILGPRLNIFSLHEEAPGFPFLHTKGMIIWNRLLEYWRKCHRKAGYSEIRTPTLMKRSLWELSGHWANYRENMFTSTIEEKEFAIKPMNCPGAMLWYKSTGHSYREFPLRIAEIGLVHRYEATGALSGLLRVRSFHQDDAHVFMCPEHIQDEIRAILFLVDEMYRTFGITYTLVLSTRPKEQSIGTDAEWEFTTEALHNALKESGKSFAIAEGEGAFYGPKIDVLMHDALGRTWQSATIQLDMILPERFDLEYTAADGTKKRPVMVHRVIYGGIERFLGALIEFYAGKFPLWLSPSQIAIIPVADRHHAYANALKDRFFDYDFEVHVDHSSESVSKKIREAQLAQYNYILTAGDAELTAQTISVRTRDNVVHGSMDCAHFLDGIVKERQEKRLTSFLS